MLFSAEVYCSQGARHSRVELHRRQHGLHSNLTIALGVVPRGTVAIAWWQWRCVTDGCVTSVSVLMNGASAASAVATALSLGVSVGLHWNLTEGQPLLPPHAVPTLLCPDASTEPSTTPSLRSRAQFLGKMEFREAVKAGRVSMKEVSIDAVRLLRA